jgi:hypothetical protein
MAYTMTGMAVVTRISLAAIRGRPGGKGINHLRTEWDQI